MARDADARADIEELKKGARADERVMVGLNRRIDALCEALGYRIERRTNEFGLLEAEMQVTKLETCTECGTQHEERAPAEAPRTLSWATMDKRLVLWVAEQLERHRFRHGGGGVLRLMERLQAFAEGRGEAPE